MGLFYPRDHPTCTRCQHSSVPSLPCKRVENVQHFEEIPGYPRTPDRTCLPFSVVTDSAPDFSSSAYGGAMIYVSSDSLSLPKQAMRNQLNQRRRASRGGSTVKTSFTNYTSGKERPLIAFPDGASGAGEACLMATFSGGHIHEDMLKSFACGVWPTMTHGDDALGLHIHTTPRWEKEPGFVLAIKYEAVDKRGLWLRRSGEPTPYHLDLETTTALSRICDTLAETWITEQLYKYNLNPMPKRTKTNGQYLSPETASNISRARSQKPARPSPRASPGGAEWPKKPREIPNRKGSVCTTATQKTSVSFASLFSSPSAPPQSSPILASLSTFNQMSISGSVRKAGGTPGPSRQGSRDWPTSGKTVDAPRVPVRLPRPQRQSSTSMRGR